MSLLADLSRTRFVRRSDAAAPAPLSRQRFDAASVYNEITGSGGNFDKGASGRPNTLRIPLDELECEALYAGNGIARRVVNIKPSRACRRGWSVPDIGTTDRTLGTWAAVRGGQTWADLYGGAIAVMVTEDDIPAGIDPDQWSAMPMDHKRIGKLLNLPVFDALEAWPYRYDQDIRSPGYRMPSHYQISAPGVRKIVHASRVLHFRGNPRPPNKVRGGWMGSRWPDDSAYQAIWDEVNRLSQLNQAGATLAQELREGVLQVGGLANKATSDEDEAFWAHISLIPRLRSLLGLTVIDAADTYTNSSTPPTGYGELSAGGWTALSAATGIPQTILQGESPGGLNADGESAHQGFRQEISDYAETRLRTPLEQFYRVVYASQDGPTRGKAPEGWQLVFAPLDEPTEASVAAARLVTAQADAIYVQMGALSPENIARSRFGAEGYSFELQEEVIPEEDEEAIAAALAEEMGRPVLPDDPAAAPVENVAATALNGAQVTALVDIVVQVSTGALPRDAAVAIVERAFQVSSAEADQLLGTAGKGFVPTTDPA